MESSPSASVSPAPASTVTVTTVTRLFDDEDADLVLISSDGSHFRVHKFILGKTSSFFRDMFTIPTPLDDNDGGPPEVPLAEPANIVEAFLRICYAKKRLRNIPFEDIAALYEVGRKYDMEGVVDAALEMARQCVETMPVRAFALGVLARDKELVREAASMCLRHPLAEIISSKAPELAVGVPASAYQSLLLHHTACTQAAVTAVTTFYTWPKSPEPPWCSECNDTIFSPVYSNTGRVKWYTLTSVWWKTLQEDTIRVLKSSAPLGFSFDGSSIRIYPPASVMACPKCSQPESCIPGLLEFTKHIEEMIRKSVQLVCLSF